MITVYPSLLNDLRNRGELCDGTIKCNDSFSFKVHRAILSTASPYFKAVFTNALHPHDNDIKEVMVDIPSNLMNLILEYIYTGQCAVAADYVEDLLVYADRYEILGIVDICCNFFLKILNPKNCIGITKFAQAYFCRQLENTSRLYTRHNFSKVLEESTELRDISLDEIFDILKDDELNIKNEQVVLKAINAWINHDIKHREKHISTLLDCIRHHHHPFDNLILHSEEMRSSHYTTTTMINLSRPRIPYEIIFAVGGWGSRSPTSCMETYDIRADKWLPCGDIPPGPRAYHAVCSLNKYLYVIGGFDGRNHFNTVNRFDPLEKNWQERACMHEARCYVSVTVEGDRIYALGGFNGISRLKSVERYSPEYNQWKIIASMNKSRSDASAATFNGKIYIVGGINGQEILDSGEVFDPVCNQWTYIRPMNSPRSGVSLVAHDGVLYVFGGFNGSIRLNTCEKLNLMQSSNWKLIAGMNSVRSNSASVIIDEMIFIIGGFNGFRTISTVECYDVEKGKWSPVMPMSMNRSGLSACVIAGLRNAKEYAYAYNKFAEDKKDEGSRSN